MTHVSHPRLSNALIGHDNVLARLMAMDGAGRLPHGLLFSGKRGIGKASTAYALAKYLLSGSPADKSSISQHPSAKQVGAGSHPDVYVLESHHDDSKETTPSMSVQHVRDFVSFFTQKSFYGGWRIGIVDPVEDLNRQGANALLKLLEEPPHKTLIILITHRIDSVLDTLRSRCQTIPFKELSQEECQRILGNFEIPDVPFLSKHCGGSPGIALDLDKMGGEEFYTLFQNALQALNNKDLRPTYKLLETYVLSPQDHSKDNAWAYFNELLLAEIARLGINTTGFLPHFRPQDLSKVWFEIGEMISTTNTFNLDRKQTLVCIFSKLAGLV